MKTKKPPYGLYTLIVVLFGIAAGYNLYSAGVLKPSPASPGRPVSSPTEEQPVVEKSPIRQMMQGRFQAQQAPPTPLQEKEGQTAERPTVVIREDKPATPPPKPSSPTNSQWWR